MPHIVETTIESVTVFEEAALVTRVGRLPQPMLETSLELQLKGLPLVLHDESIRVTLIDTATWTDSQGDVDAVARRVGAGAVPGWGVRDVSVEVDATGPPQQAQAGARFKALQRELEDLEARIGGVEQQIRKLEGWMCHSSRPSSSSRQRKKTRPRPYRFDAWSQFVRTCEDRLSAFHEERRNLLLERGRKQLDMEGVCALLNRLQAGDIEEVQSLCKNVAFTITASAASPQPPDRVAVSYIVPGAMWRPAYRLYLEDGSRKARLVMGAQVAQRSGEDWPAARLHFSAARLDRLIQLRELPSRRIGRAQVSRPKGWIPKQPPPKGLFAAYDHWLEEGLERPDGESPPAEQMLRDCQALARQALMETPADKNAATASLWTVPLPKSRPTPQRPQAGATGELAPLPPPPPPMPPAQPSPAPSEVRRRAEPASWGGAGTIKVDLLPTERKGLSLPSLGDMVAGVASVFMKEDDEYAGASDLRDYRPSAPRPQPPAPAGNYLRYELCGVDCVDMEVRGRLRHVRAFLMSERVEFPEPTVRGLIDRARSDARVDLPAMAHAGIMFVYDAQGRANVPQDGHAHTVELAGADGAPETRYRTIPMTDPQVFARLHLPNPLPFPLPPGDVQVFHDNAYAFTTSLSPVGTGGEAVFPLGVEQRLKVARNVTYHQDEKGLTGGNTEATHGIDIKLRSHMPDRVVVEILERVPVPDESEKKLDVRIKGSQPQAETVEIVDQRRIRGTHRWSMAVDPGGEASVRLAYAISLPAKMEVVGGNRRA